MTDPHLCPYCQKRNERDDWLHRFRGVEAPTLPDFGGSAADQRAYEILVYIGDLQAGVRHRDAMIRHLEGTERMLRDRLALAGHKLEKTT